MTINRFGISRDPDPLGLRSNKPLKDQLADIVDRLETLGENDMGNLTYAQAKSFHAATAALRKLWGRI